MSTTTAQHTRVLLTEDEMAGLDDGQEWFKAGDTVYLAGYVAYNEDADQTQGTLDLSVNGETHDNWIELTDIDHPLRNKLIAFAGSNRAQCPTCNGSGYVVYGPESWNNGFCPTCEGTRFAPVVAE